MALELEREMSTGVKVSYWKIAETNINWANGTIEVVLYGFLNKVARFAGKGIIYTERIKIGSGTIASISSNDIVKTIYLKLKEDSFKDAVDV